MLTPLEKFVKICEKREGARLISGIGFGGREFRVCAHGEALGAITGNPKHAIDLAFEELFPTAPPIPKSVGEDKEEWEWSDLHKIWKSCTYTRAHLYWESGKKSYFFAQSSSLSAQPNYPHYLSAAEIRGFLKLIEVNPELKEPTEE